jgi:hypothetical protein
MNCTDFRSRLDDGLDDALDAESAREWSAHEANCRSCATHAAQERSLRAALRDLPAPKMPAGFPREALLAARVANRAMRRKPRLLDLRLAAAASLAALAVVSGGWWYQRAAEPPAHIDLSATKLETWALTAGEVQSLRLRIESPRDFEGVRFSVELPDHVFLAGQPGIRAMTWEGRLRKGQNVLELPLVAQAGAAGRVATRVSWGSFEQRLETGLVSVPGSGSSGGLHGLPQSGA